MRTPLALLLLLAACDREPALPEPVADAPRPVQVAEIRLSPGLAQSTHVGVVRARREATLGFRTNGRITARLVDIGDVVAAGQVLARIDPTDLTLARDSAAADLAAAEAEARRTAADAARSRTLRAAGHVAAGADEQRQASAQSAAERVAAARAALDLAESRLGYAALIAPAAGVVTALVAEIGQVVDTGDPVLRMADTEAREVLVRVPETALPGLSGAEAEVWLWARPGQTLRATLREVAPEADSALRTYAARFTLTDAPDWVALGMTASLRLTRDAAPVASVPLTALHDRGQGPMLWRLVEDGRVEAVPVTIRALGDTTADISGPLEPGQRVVALGPQLLDPASRVRVVGTRLAASLR
jgi:RND family efflux transporter MFP subunit